MRPHTNNSFSYKTIHPNIRNILEERSKLDNTTQVSMPFIKATTTLQLPEILGNGIGFTLGIHATELDIKYQDIYASQNGSYLTGYTYQPDGTNKLIYADPPAGIENILKVFDLGSDIHNTTDFSAVPPPGITRVTIGKRRSGLISVANISFSVPTLIQLEFLHRAFLVPGIGMILEWGQQFAPKKTEFSSGLGETGLIDDFSQYMFPWYGENAYGETKEELFQRLARNQISTQEILEKYSYPTQGQYQWMFGRVGNFNINSNPDGSYECMVRIVGPAEDSWAYSVRNTSVPTTRRSTAREARVCLSDTNSVESYFTKESGIDSFIGAIEATINSSDTSQPMLRDWKPFVKKFIHPSGDNLLLYNTNESGDSTANDLEDAYFISWRYFVNVILNDENYGVKSIFKNTNELPDWLDKISLLRPYKNINGEDWEIDNFEDPYENFVGTNLFLRSTDLSTMILVNEEAARSSANDSQRKTIYGTLAIDESDREFLTQTPVGRGNNLANEMFSLGDFYKSAQNVNNPPRSRDDLFDRAFLSTGVWINHKAIIQSFSTANTILDGIQNLLTRMSSATNGFWNLAVDISEPVYEVSDENEEQSFGTVNGIDVYNYSVVDLNYVEHSDYAVNEFLSGDNRVHVFNKYIRDKNGTLLGSDLTDCKVELSLPQTMFSQIATMGLVQPEDRDIESEQEFEPAVISDIHDELRKMFSITSIARRDDGTSADLTAIQIQKPNTDQCGSEVALTTSRTDGVLTEGTADTSTENLNTTKDIESRIRAVENQINDLESFIKGCKEICQFTETETPSVVEQAFNLESPWSARFISYVASKVDSSFPKNALHTAYAQAIREGRISGWESLDPRTNTPQRGDIIIRNREGNNLDFDTRPWTGVSHGNVVVGIEDGEVISIGGNLRVPGNVIYDTREPLNLPTKYFTILRPPSRVADGLATAAEREESLWAAADATGRRNLLIKYFRAVDVNPLTTPTASSIIDEFTVCNTDQPVSRATGSINNREDSSASTNLVANSRIQQDATFVIGSRPPAAAEINVENCNEALRNLQLNKNQLNQLNIRKNELTKVKKLENLFRDFPHLKKLFWYLEPFTDYMVANIRKTSDGSSSNVFGAAPGALSIKADLELPGINGLRLGELFWLDRIPSFYRAYGAFIVLGIEEEITPNGWITKIGSSFYYLGNAWKVQMAKILSGDT
jgi:hypothetical protein